MAAACKTSGVEHNVTTHCSFTAVGADINQIETSFIATDPSFVYEVPGFETLYNVTQTIINMTCEVCKLIIHTPSSKFIAKPARQDYR